MKSLPMLHRLVAALPVLVSLNASAATIPGLYNTGVSDAGTTLANGAIDPHWKLVQSPDVTAPGPNTFVVTDTLFPIVGTGPWLASSTTSKWIGPMANQSTGNQAGDYKYRITFSLAGLEPSTAVITGRWTSDNAGPEVLINGQVTGATSDGNFGGLGNTFTINSGFIDGTNTLDFVVNNAGSGANPTAFRLEFTSATADPQPPPGTPPSITTQPAPVTVGLLDSATFNVVAAGSRPFSYQWRFNGAQISGATSANYSLANAGTANEGGYDVIVSNASGSVTSQVASLTLTFLSPAQRSYEPLGPSTRRTGLTFSEIMYHPTADGDGQRTEFIEIYNSNPFFEDISGWRLTGDIDFTFPENTIIQGNSFLVVAPVPADVESAYSISGVVGGFTNNLPNEGGSLRLRKRSGGIVLEVNYTDQPPWPVAADGAGHSMILARPSYGENNPQAWAASALKGGSPGSADPLPAGLLENVVINEILAHTDLPLLDYIELFNNSSLPVNLSGCWLSDDPATNKFRIPDGTTLGARGFVVFDQTQLGFSLASDGETVYLVSSNQTRVLAALRYDGQANGVACGRFPDGAPAFQELQSRTPGTTNAPSLTRDIVITEVMYNPLSGDSDDEFIEIHNDGEQPVDISGWRFTSGINFTFPAGTTLDSGAYLAVAKNASRLATNYQGLSSANLIGNYGGTLANGGERVALAMPDYGFTTNTSGVIATNVFYIVMDEVTYVDGGRWGRWSDGGGSSLELRDTHADNRAGANWTDSDDTAKSAWTTVEFTGVLDLGSGAADRVQVMLLGPGEALVDDVEVIVSGANRVPNSTFESGTNGWIFGGTHSKTSLENTGFNSSRSLHLRASDRGDLTANRLSAQLSAAVAANSTATLRAKVKWLRGHPEILIRLKGNYIEAFGRLPVPTNLGTPGAANSTSIQNLGPVITETTHRPILPQAGQTIRVTTRVADPDGVQSVTLNYRIDPSTTLTSVTMIDDGTGGDALAGDGIYTAQIPGQATGKLVAFHIAASDSNTGSSLFPSDAPVRECLVRIGETQPPGAFGTYRLWLTDATVATWANREKTSNENLDGTFVYGTNRVIYNVGAHYSGSPYTSPGYTSPVGALCGYDIVFGEDDPFLSTTHIVLDWPVRDDTNQREQLMYWFLEQYGLPNNYRRYVIMFVNGVRRGTIMDDVQQPTGETVEQWFSDDPDGALFKPDCWDEFSDRGDRETGCLDLNSMELFTTTGGVKKTARYRWVWKPRAIDGTANDYSPIFNLVDAANAATNGYQTAMESVADMDNWMRTFAMNDLASFWDAFGNPNAKNTFLYKPTQSGWKLMSWDFDVGLGVFNDPVNDPLFPDLNDDMMDRVYANPAWKRLYWGALTEGLNTFFQSGPGTKIDAILDAKYAAFQANGISLASPAAIKTWINQRRAFLLTQLNTVSNVFNVSGPATFSTNRNLISLTGTAPVTVRTITVNGIEFTPAWTTANNWRLLIPLGAGTNELVIAGFDRFGNPVPGASRTNLVEFTGTEELAADNIVINEVMYNPLVSDATYIELFNRSETYSFNLTGWRMSGVDFTFPEGTTLLPRGLLVICKDRAAFGNAYGWGIPAIEGFNGQLDNGGETLTLIRPGATAAEDAIVDRVTYDDDLPWPAVADGSGASLQLIDANQDNNRVSNWTAGNGWKFFSLTRSVGTSVATNLAFFFQPAANPGNVYLDDVSLVQGSDPSGGPNLLANGGFEEPFAPAWRVAGPATNSVITTSVAHSGNSSAQVIFTSGTLGLNNFSQSFPALTTNTVYTFSFWYLSGTAGTNFSFRINTSFTGAIDPRSTPYTPGSPNSGIGALPAYPELWLSEVQPENVTGLKDNAGDNDPWIEIYNGGDSALSLDGFHLANNYSSLSQWAFPAGASIGAGEFLLVWADNELAETTAAALHTNFRLTPTNGSVVLSRLVNGAPQIVDYFNYAGVEADRSYGASPDGQSSYRQNFFYVTPGTTNNPAAKAVTLFINEWMAANASFLRDPADQDFDDWFEIYNPTSNTVDLTGFTLTDDFTRPGKSVIPAGMSVRPLGYLLVWADEEPAQTQPGGDLHVNFRLGQGGEQIALYDSAGRLLDAITFGAQTNNLSQGRWPSGGPAPFCFMSTPTPRAANVIPTSNPPVLAVNLGNNAVSLVWSAQAGRSYRVQYKNDLNATDWIDLGDPVTAAGATASLTDAGSGNQRFYRVVLIP